MLFLSLLLSLDLWSPLRRRRCSSCSAAASCTRRKLTRGASRTLTARLYVTGDVRRALTASYNVPKRQPEREGKRVGTTFGSDISAQLGGVVVGADRYGEEPHDAPVVVTNALGIDGVEPLPAEIHVRSVPEALRKHQVAAAMLQTTGKNAPAPHLRARYHRAAKV